MKQHIESLHSKVTYSCDHWGYKATHKLEETLQLKQNHFKFSGFHVMYVKLCFAVRAIKKNTFITNSTQYICYSTLTEYNKFNITYGILIRHDL